MEKTTQDYIKEINDKYGINLSPIHHFQRQLLDFYIDRGFLSSKQVECIKNPPIRIHRSKSYTRPWWADDREYDSMFASCFDWGSQ